jgi:hypothetical protein
MKRFCVRGHDTYSCGRYPDRGCVICRKLRARIYNMSAKAKTIKLTYQVDHPDVTRLANYRQGAKRRGLLWEIDKELFFDLTTSQCFYCGTMPDPLNGIDRVDNAIGYVFGNVVSCCVDCNRAKGIRSRREFETWARAVSEKALESGVWS